MNLSKRTGTPADALHSQAREDAARNHEETCQAIAEGLADMDAGRTIPFEEVRAQWEAEKSGRREKTP